MGAMIDLEIERYLLTDRSDRRNRGVKRALPFAIGLRGEYVHRVRYCTYHDIHARPHLSVSCWCGMSLIINSKRGRLLAEPSENRPMCATCEGRAIGAGLLGSREIAGKFVMFRPRT